MKLTASANVLTNKGNGTQNWGDSVTLTAFDLDGNVGQVAYDTEFKDRGFGVAGGRWQQIDYFEEGGGRSERLEINFGGSVSDIVLTLGQMKEGERTYAGKKYDETGKWTAYNVNGKKVATGLLGPDQSNLGSGNKVSGTYGQYSIELKGAEAVGKIVIEATGFGNGKAPSRSRNGVEDSSDFNLVDVSYDRISYGKNAFIVEKPVEQPAKPPVVEEPVEQPAKPLVVEEPIIEEPVEEPIEQPVKSPVVEKPVEQPIVEEPVEQQAKPPVVEEPVEQPVVEEPVEQPVEPPVVEQAVEQSIVEELVEQPVEQSIKEPSDRSNEDGEKIELDAVRDILDGSKNKQVWNKDVSISGLTANGKAGTVFYSRSGFGVKEGGSKFQIDYLASANQSEQLVIDFNRQIDRAQLELGLMEDNEWNNFDETGVWTAYNAQGKQVGSGVLEPSQGTKVGGDNYLFQVGNLSESFSKIKIAATAYGNGVGTNVTDNNSDFNLRGLTYTVDSSNQPTISNSSPDAKNDGGFKILENTSLTIPASELLNNDSDPDGDALNVKWVGNAKNGTVSLDNNKITFLPNTSYSGQAKFNYTIADSVGNTARALVNIDVTQSGTNTEKPSDNYLSMDNSSTTKLIARKNIIDNGNGTQTWGNGVNVSGLTADGRASSINYSRGGFAVAGNRYDYQIDYDAVSGKSEKIVIDFDRAITKAKLDIGFMSTNEWNGLNETGKWTAYDDAGRKIDSGVLDPSLGVKLGSANHLFEIDSLPEAFSQLTVEATAYGNGIGGDRSNNNSDFNLRAITYTEA